ncbi:hypothetical protein WI560_13595 [Bradyrhizobium sp. A11]
MRTCLESRRREMRRIDLDVATFICVSAIEAVAHNTVLSRAEVILRGISPRSLSNILDLNNDNQKLKFYRHLLRLPYSSIIFEGRRSHGQPQDHYPV